MDYIISEMSEEKKPTRNLRDDKISGLSKSELFSIVLNKGDKKEGQISKEILNDLKLSSMAREDLDRLEEDIPQKDLDKIQAMLELKKRSEDRKERINCLSDVKRKIEDMKMLDTEELRVFILSSDNELLRREVFKGRIDSIDFSFRSVFREAIRKDGSAIVMAHNHPSGYSRPTEKDIQTTKEMIELGSKLNITVLDHIIVGEEISSMRKDSSLEF